MAGANYELTHHEVRDAAGDVDEQIINNDALTDLIVTYTGIYHSMADISTAYDKTTHFSDFSRSREIIKSLIVSKIATDPDKRRDALAHAKFLLKNITNSQGDEEPEFLVSFGGPNVTDELNPVNYTHDASSAPRTFS